MRQTRWRPTWLHEQQKSQFYHCISYVVNRESVLGPQEKEKFREIMRTYEGFTGCRVLTYVLMNEHIHLMLEVPPMPKDGLSDAELLRRVAVLYGQERAEALQLELKTAREMTGKITAQMSKQTSTQSAGTNQALCAESREVSAIVPSHQASPSESEAKPNEAVSAVQKIHRRYTYRMHHLSEFMKGLMQSYTQWHNRRHKRRGHLWEDRFKSVIVEDGNMARTLSAYIQLNPVRSGYVQQPEEYRWSSYGEAVGGAWTDNGTLAQAGLVRLWGAYEEMPADAKRWKSEVAPALRMMMVEEEEQENKAPHENEATPAAKATADAQGNSMEGGENGVDDEGTTIEAETTTTAGAGNATKPHTTTIGGIPLAKVLRLRIRYFTDGMVIGTKAFLEEAFQAGRERFGANRKTGARKLRGNGAPLAEEFWSMRDLQQGID